jgi:predicted alpha/beta superfamily hydrolase
MGAADDQAENEDVVREKPAPQRRHTLTGDIRYHYEFTSRYLPRSRTLIVYLPPGYADEAPRRYPVLYLHDGQNVFDAATSFAGTEWQADETAERLIRAGRLAPLILVGVYNTEDRLAEYTPWRDTKERAGGKGKHYARFLVDEVKPFIDREYRTLPGREHTAVAGSSLGGLISLYLAKQYPDRFSRCGALSPSLWWANERILREIERSPGWLKHVRVWLDMGTREGQRPGAALAGTRRLVESFDQMGLIPGRDYYYQEVFEGEHNEAAWAARFDKVLLFFFGT